MDVEQSRQWIETRVRTIIRSESPNEPTNASKIGIDTSDDRNIELRLDDSGHGVKVVDDLLLVVAPRHEVQKVKDVIDTFTRFTLTTNRNTDACLSRHCGSDEGITDSMVARRGRIQNR